MLHNHVKVEREKIFLPIAAYEELKSTNHFTDFKGTPAEKKYYY